ncbi:hypothetical protein NLI96_g8563 [Meripilus lineatus]|uniref:Uncharacterized protein n=1 Tax=Meripilus lineatus TaxID=2056292 RepID=A0AAD5UZD1_9APHY|nr:hypothetical protein NLI96_g8563 [Physisporinus lineatus]
MDGPWRFPRVLVCASDSLGDLDAAELPLWAQTTIVIAKTYIQPLEIDVAARVESGRDLEKVKNALKGVSKYIHADNLSHDAPVPRVPVKPEHTHVVLVGIEPLIAINDDLTTIYIPTASQPASRSYTFSRLGSNGFVVLLEKEARTLLAEFTPEKNVTALTGRELVRALVAQPSLNDFDAEDEDDYEREERYEFEIDPAIIEGAPKSTSGCVAAFVGKFIGGCDSELVSEY